MEALRREAERQDYYGGTVLLHSLTGGTGSGLGARLCEEIREEFPVGHILTVSVVPHQSGESPLQHYNTLLSLAALHRSADGILLFHNDHVLSRSGFQQKSHAGFGTVSCGFPQSTHSVMNAHITSCMAGLLMPVKTLTTGRKISARIKGKVYRTVVRPTMLYGLETVSLRKRQESELEVAELKMLRFSLGVTRLDRIRNEYIRGTAHVGRLGDKVREARLRWFGHVQRREMTLFSMAVCSLRYDVHNSVLQECYENKTIILSHIFSTQACHEAIFWRCHDDEIISVIHFTCHCS
ncbi:hypothetical protein QTP70_000051 [Hemibagrus guttatus]|uniref:Tubulin/FtsZ GTPase domain-containing protein n=1 Tax=Hemibagrus guttatus TaxID=175788 RepID=A0AAE0RDS7_9TELE|nr:hypothetical protein QTP70_000051 [Hemibagrus guttatus]